MEVVVGYVGSSSGKLTDPVGEEGEAFQLVDKSHESDLVECCQSKQ